MLILDKLWQGETSPCERYCQKNSQVQELNDALAEKSKALDCSLSEEARALWNDYSDLRSRIEMLSCEDSYIEGVRFGVLLMLDTLSRNDDNFTDSGDGRE